MDGSIIQSLMGGSVSTENKGKRPEAADGDAFSKALDDATGKPGGKASQSMIDEKSDKAGDKKEEKKKQAKAEQEEMARVTQQKLDKSTPAYLQKLMQLNPDAMTMAEKQTARVAEFSGEAQARGAQKPGAQPQPQAQSPTGPRVSTGANPQATAARGQAEFEGSKDRTAPKEVDSKDRATFEKMVAEAPGEKGPVNLEKLLSQEAKAAEGAQKSQMTERAQERQNLLDQILSQIEVRNLANKTELNLRLNPEYLGELKMNLVHTADGVRADFSTTSRATRELLQEGEEELREQAKAKGVRMGEMRFKVVESLA